MADPRRGPRIKQPLSERLYRRFVHKYFEHDLNFELQLMARRDAALYVREHMAAATMYADRWRLLAAAAEQAPAGGLFLEFGVEKGASANFLAALLADGAVLHAFDSFAGLPEAWHGTFETRGKFAVGGVVPPLLPNVSVHKGWFAETLPEFCRQHHNSGVSLLHIDCDLYSSTATVLAHVGTLLRPGSVVVFDEYFNYHGWQNHEFRAWQEFVAARGVEYSYRGFCGRGGQVLVQVDAPGLDTPSLDTFGRTAAG